MQLTRTLFGSAVVALSLAAGVTTAAPAHGVALEAQQNSTYGRYLTDGQGRTLYMFARDTQNSGKSTCSGQCAAVWPPVLARQRPQVAAQLDARKLGEITRADGQHQLTYDGWPLYHYTPDQGKPGAITGQAIESFGAPWYLLSPSGQVIRKAARPRE